MGLRKKVTRVINKTLLRYRAFSHIYDTRCWYSRLPPKIMLHTYEVEKRKRGKSKGKTNEKVNRKTRIFRSEPKFTIVYFSGVRVPAFFPQISFYELILFPARARPEYVITGFWYFHSVRANPRIFTVYKRTGCRGCVPHFYLRPDWSARTWSEDILYIPDALCESSLRVVYRHQCRC